MVYAAFNYTITDESGNIVTGASIEVRRESDNGLATLYSDRAGASPIANPFTDSTGTGRFHAAGNAYKVTATKGAFTRSFRYVPVGLAGESDTFIKTITANSGEGVSIDPTDPFNPIVTGVAFTGDSGSGGVKGMVPAPAAGDAAANKYLKADGLWTAVAAGGGSVRIIDYTGGIYTPAAGTKAIMVYLTGGGGGGGSAAVQNGAVGHFSASGGNGGNTVIFTIDEDDLYSGATAKTFQITVGVGGAATGTPANTSNIDGVNGGDSSFTNFTGSTANMQIVAKGGYGGKRGAVSVRAQSVPPAASTVTVTSGFSSLKYVLLDGGRGKMSRGAYAGTGANIGMTLTAAGGDSFWGSGALEDYSHTGVTSSVSNAVAGGSASDPGTGGAGGAIRKNTATALIAAAGGAGAKGKCLILEFY